MLSGSMICSMRGRLAGRWPRLERRFFDRSRLRPSSFFSSSASFLALAVSSSSSTRLSWSSLSRSDLRPKRPRRSAAMMWWSLSLAAVSWSRSAMRSCFSARSASIIACRASMLSGSASGEAVVMATISLICRLTASKTGRASHPVAGSLGRRWPRNPRRVNTRPLQTFEQGGQLRR